MSKIASTRRLDFAAVLTLTSLMLVLALASAVRAADPQPSLAVLPFEIEDNSGELGPADKHDLMLSTLTTAVGEEITAAGRYRVVPEEQVAHAVKAANPGTYLRNCNGCELDIAKSVGAQRVLIGWIFKMSTLVGSLHVRIEDVPTCKVVYMRDFDFRGDNERAWKRAAKIFVEALTDTGEIR